MDTTCKHNIIAPKLLIGKFLFEVYNLGCIDKNDSSEHIGNNSIFLLKTSIIGTTEWKIKILSTNGTSPDIQMIKVPDILGLWSGLENNLLILC